MTGPTTVTPAQANLQQTIRQAMLDGMLRDQLNSSETVAILANVLGGLCAAVLRDGADPNLVTASVNINMQLGMRHANEAFEGIAPEDAQAEADAIRASYNKAKH